VWDQDSGNDQLMLWSTISFSAFVPGTTRGLTTSYNYGVSKRQANIRLSATLACATYRFGNDCGTYCQATSQYSCSSSGARVCAAGVYGASCDGLCQPGYKCSGGVRTACTSGSTYQGNPQRDTCL